MRDSRSGAKTGRKAAPVISIYERNNRKPKSRKLLIGLLILLPVTAILIMVLKYYWVTEPVTNVAVIEKDALFLFVPTPEARLTQRKVEVKMGMGEREKADLIIHELKKARCLADKTVLYDLAADDNGTIYLNLSRDIRDGVTDGAREVTTTYALVNSFLSNFRGVTKLQLLVEGEPLYTLNGVVYTYLPLEFNKSLLEEK
jgi:hypothetical protein